MNWVLLVLAGCFEVAFTTCMKKSDGFKQPLWTVAFGVAAISSFVLLTLATKTIPLGTAYAVWTGLGAAGTIAVGILVFGESAAPARLLFLALIIVGVIGVKFAG